MTVACAPRTLATISQTKFEALKKLMDRCVDHVVGEAPSPIIRQGVGTMFSVLVVYHLYKFGINVTA